MHTRTTATLVTMIAALTGCATHREAVIPDRRGLPYIEAGGNRQQGDLYLPEGTGPFPAAVVIHGGGWNRRDRSDMAAVARQLAESGIAAYNINYRLAPEHNHPAQLNDVHSALRYMEANAERWRLDPKRFITVGYSSGGHLALLAAELPDPHGPKVAAVIAGGAPIDFLLYPESPPITQFIGGTPAEMPHTWREASPIHHVTPEHPPVFLYHGRWDQIVGYTNAKKMKTALEKVDVPVQLYTHYLYGHLLLGIRQRPAVKEGILFVKKHLDIE